MHFKTSAIVAMVALFVFSFAACGGDDDDTGPATTAVATTETAGSPTTVGTAAVTTPTGNAGSGATTGQAGFVVVDGKQIALTQTRRCKPFSGRAEDLDLTGIGPDVQVFVNINRLISNSPAVGHELSIQGNAVGGAFSGSANSFDGNSWIDEDGQPIAGAPFVVTPDRVSGGMVVADARGSGATHEVSFDIAIPSEIIEC